MIIAAEISYETIDETIRFLIDILYYPLKTEILNLIIKIEFQQKSRKKDIKVLWCTLAPLKGINNRNEAHNDKISNYINV